MAVEQMDSIEVEIMEKRCHDIKPSGGVIHISPVDTNLPQLLNEAKDGTDVEKLMSIRQALLTYRKAILSSVVLSMAVIMEGYSATLMTAFFTFPSFTKKYGFPTGDLTRPYQIPAQWKAGLVNGAYVGEILGLFICGILSERYGYRKTMIISLISVVAFVFILFFARGLLDLLIGEVLCAIPWGVFQVLTTAYASEVCPTQLRAYLTTYVNLCWIMGQLVGVGVLRRFIERTDQWSYKIPFALQWVLPVPIIVGALLAAESPW